MMPRPPRVSQTAAATRHQKAGGPSASSNSQASWVPQSHDTVNHSRESFCASTCHDERREQWGHPRRRSDKSPGYLLATHWPVRKVSALPCLWRGARRGRVDGLKPAADAGRRKKNGAESSSITSVGECQALLFPSLCGLRQKRPPDPLEAKIRLAASQE